MSDSLKEQIGDVHVSILPEEIDTIFGLKNTYDYFENLWKLCLIVSGIRLEY